MAEVNMTPPEAVQRACKRGLVLFEEGKGGDGLEPATIKEARSMARGESQTEAKIRKGNRWWARNERFLDEPSDSPAMVSALLWGGAPGRDWFRKVYRQLTEQQQKSEGMEMNTRQHRQFNLRMDGADATTAGLKGMALMYGRMDTYQTVFAPGSATGCLPDFVANGAFLGNHDADDLAIGYIKSAVDNGNGIEVEVDYHTTGDAQDARTVAIERLKAGKKVGLSIGFTVGDYIQFENGEALLLGAQNLGMDMNFFDMESIRKCNRSCYLLTRLAKMYEVSQVNFPAVPDSEATSVRNNNLGDSLAGITLADQLANALDALRLVTERASEVATLRCADNKTLGKSTLESIHALRTELDALIAQAEMPTALERQQAKFDQIQDILK
jgi:phage head maturation protease